MIEPFFFWLGMVKTYIGFIEVYKQNILRL